MWMYNFTRQSEVFFSKMILPNLHSHQQSLALPIDPCPFQHPILSNCIMYYHLCTPKTVHCFIIKVSASAKVLSVQLNSRLYNVLNLSFPWNAKPNKGLYASNLFRDIIPGNKSRELGKHNRKREKINIRAYFWVGHNCRQLGPNPIRTSQKQTILKHSSEWFGQQWKKGALAYLWLPSRISQGFTQAFNSLTSHHTQARASSRTPCWNIKEALGWKMKYSWWG